MGAGYSKKEGEHYNISSSSSNISNDGPSESRSPLTRRFFRVSESTYRPPRDISGPLGPVPLHDVKTYVISTDVATTAANVSVASSSASEKSKTTRIKTKVLQVVGRAGTAGLGKAVDALDTIGSSMTNLNLGVGSGFQLAAASKGNKIGILAFEVANTIAKGYNLKLSLSADRIRYLKEEVLCSEGVQRLISTDMEELLSIAAEDKRKELTVFAKEVVRFGNQCRDPQWHNLDRYFNRLGKEMVQNQSKEEIEEELQILVVWAQQTAELYHELNSLDRFEAEIRRKLQDENLYSNYSRGDSLSALRVELKSRAKNVKSLKRKSLWSKTLEEVMEKMVDAVYLLHLEIEHAFGDGGNTSLRKRGPGKTEDSERLGSLGLALHYACIIGQIDSLVCRPGTVPGDTRDNLYQSLPPTIKAALRHQPAALKTKNQFNTISSVKEELDEMLGWLVPIATNTTKVHHGFGWVGEWANTGSSLDMGHSAQSSSSLIQTLHHANRKKTEDYILQMLFLLQDLVNLAQHNILEFRATSVEKTRDHDEQLYEPLDDLTQLDMKQNKSFPEDQVETSNHDVNNQDLKVEMRLSQEFERNGDSSRDISKSRSHSSSRSMEDLLSPKSLNHVHLVPMIDIGIDRVKSLDVIDRVDDI